MLEYDRLRQENEELKRRLRGCEDAYKHRIKMWQSARSAAFAWEGKFHQVKRENNALRRKLYQQGKKAVTEQIELDLSNPEGIHALLNMLTGHRIVCRHRVGDEVVIQTTGLTGDLEIHLALPREQKPVRKTLPMAIAICMTTSSHREGAVRLTLQDELSCICYANVEIGLEEFARALLGQGHIPCTVEVPFGAPIGKRREHKHEVVPIPQGVYSRSPEAMEAVRAAVAPFEVNGWQATRPLDLFNSHCRVRDHHGDSRARIGFERWVDAPDE